ncbi:aromatic ring-hydroxylating oxygenase subunit alpha [Nakamurella leprariae]|uniref:Aromatic ring-hydroxylating dioxygenase subunit alpha n=1 Tax=Nakamurella leprariae TaxID=2803911 RepID=A0A938YJX5_9ACTN|nr:aromatic ring-hydroxylating dioxygenase subunit alpha [Nakamurella leprariae]MBM9469529.1 aromatic ring-hydroxylating dioxygenase subunit alpha [Nakamurella leprariae]
MTLTPTAPATPEAPFQAPATTTNGSGNTVTSGPLDGRPVGRAMIPARAYTGQAEFDAEQQSIFSSGWVWAGFAHWVANPGDVKPLTVGGSPLLMIRGEDGELRVFHNSCRHRGMALTEEPIQVTQRIQCAYHCWSYHLDGSLAVAPYFKRERRTNPDKDIQAQLSLLPVVSEVWAGMVFVNLAADPSDPDRRSLADLVAPLQQRWSHIDFDRIHLAQERDFDIDANWKLVVENFLDWYHLPFIHPQVGSVAASLDIDDVVMERDIVGGCYPRGAAGKAKKTEQQLPWLGDVPEAMLERQDIFCVFPNALLFLEADWFQVIGFDPIAPDHTVEHMAIFVDRAAANEDFGPAIKRLCEVLYEVNEQDMPILHKLQTGRRSPGSDRTYLVPQWDQVTAFFQQRVAEKAGY